MMTDKNGREIVTGMVVRIENAYYKTDNALYVVTNVPGDPCWTGTDCGLRKIRKDGQESKAKGRYGFWPVATMTVGYKAAIARNWNAEHATIEIVELPDTHHLVGFFQKEKADAETCRDWTIKTFGKDHRKVAQQQELVDHYQRVIDRLEGKA